MKKLVCSLVFMAIALMMTAQAPQKLSYQAVIRNAAGKLIQSTPVGIRITILQGFASGTAVYAETHSVTTNTNGLVTLAVGEGTTSGDFTKINWANGPYYLKTETDPTGGTNYSVTGTSQLLSVPYALFAGNGFSGNYNDLTNKPVTDGSETKVTAGKNIQVSGTGTTLNPYIISGAASPAKTVLTNSQNWIVPSGVSKIKVELWGGSGGGGGAGVYSYSYAINNGGFGGSGGYAEKEMNVTQNKELMFIIGNAGAFGINATFSGGSWYGDSNGGDGGTSQLTISSATELIAAGGTGGKKGSFSTSTVNGLPGTGNTGTITGYCNMPQSNILNIFYGLPRSYISDRILTSPPGKGGIVSGYSGQAQPTAGEGGCAIITFLE